MKLLFKNLSIAALHVVKLCLNIETGRAAHGAFLGNHPAARAGDAPSHTAMHIQKHYSRFLYTFYLSYINVSPYDKAPIMMFHFESI